VDKETKEEKWWEAMLAGVLTFGLIIGMLLILGELQVSLDPPKYRITREVKACNSYGCQIDGEFEENKP